VPPDPEPVPVDPEPVDPDPVDPVEPEPLGDPDPAEPETPESAAVLTTSAAPPPQALSTKSAAPIKLSVCSAGALSGGIVEIVRTREPIGQSHRRRRQNTVG
jgi:hypothetical protein